MYSVYTVCIVILVSMVTAREILENGDDEEEHHRHITRSGGGSGRIGGVFNSLGYVAPLLRLLSYLVGVGGGITNSMMQAYFTQDGAE